MKIGVLYSRVRVEEKWIFEALERRGVDYDKIDDRQIELNLAEPGSWLDYDVILERSLSYKNGLYTSQVLNAWGIPTVNMAHVAATCGDKLATSAALTQAGVPQPKVWLAFTAEAALEHYGNSGLPGCDEAGHWIVGPAAGQDQRPRGRRGDPRTQRGPGFLPALGFLHPGIYSKARPGYPLVCDRRPDRVRHLPQRRALDYQHGPRRQS